MSFLNKSTKYRFDDDFMQLLEQMLDERYVVRQKHPTADLFIYNYSPKTQFEWSWNKVTLQARGLILDKEGYIVARPLPKFFNLEEKQPEEIPNEAFQVYEKLDGSLGVMYFVDNKPYIATRGSFNSEQSIRANELLQAKYVNCLDQFNPEYTYLFEIIYPENRIVVNYGEREELILLAVIDKATGKDVLPLPEIGIPKAKHYAGFTKLTELREDEMDNHEGFIVRFDSGYRVKVKFAEYKRLHYLMANVSTKTIWLNISNEKTIDDILEIVPDEFYPWVRNVVADFHVKYKEVEDLCRSEFKTFDSRKEAAAYFLGECTYPPILFKMLDGRDYSEAIWKRLEPAYERPFNKWNQDLQN